MTNEAMKDVGSTSFGLLIAYLLPGFAGMFAIGFYAPPVTTLFSQFLAAESNVGRFLLMILCSLVVGLEISLLRWLLFERFLCRKHKREKSNYHSLRDQAILAGFRAAVDENYRYHQFWGGMAIVTPFIGYGLLVQQNTCPLRIAIIAVFATLTVLNIAGASDAYKNYIDRSNKIMREVGNGEWMGPDRRGTGDETLSAATPATPATTAPTAPAAATPASSETVSKDESCQITPAP